MDQLLKIVERAGEGGLLLVEQFLSRGVLGSSLDVGAEEDKD